MACVALFLAPGMQVRHPDTCLADVLNRNFLNMYPAPILKAFCVAKLMIPSRPAVLLAVFCLAGFYFASDARVYAQSPVDVSGTWRGTLVAGQFEPLEIVFHIQGNDGSYTATLDIPAQARAGMSVDSVSVRGANIMIRMSNIQAEYYAGLVISDDGATVEALNGDWGQSGEHIPLRMIRDSR